MPWNGSGSFNRTYSWVADKAAGLNISSTRMDTDTNDIASNGFGNCLTRDGQGSASANLPMGNFRHTGVGDAVNQTDYASLKQLQTTSTNATLAGGTADALTATITPSPTLTDKQIFWITAASANATTTPTLALNGGAARTITKNGNQALAANDIFGAGHVLCLQYVAATPRYELLNPAGILGSAAKLSTARTVAMSGDLVWSVSFDGSGNVTAAGTLATVNGNVGTFAAANITVNAKGLITAASASGALIATNNLSDVSNSTTAKTNLSILKYTSPDQAITSATQIVFTHGLGGAPLSISYFLVCQTGEGGYSSGDVVQIGPARIDSANRGISSVSTSTTITLRYGSDANTFSILNSATGAIVNLTNANWKLRIIAIYF
jgi:hypothetical protein